MRIGHYCDRIWAPGGIATYIKTVSGLQVAAGNEVFFFASSDSHQNVPDSCPTELLPVDDGGTRLYQRALDLGIDLLHIHSLFDADLAASPVAVLRTVHGHQPFCPSATRYLKRSGQPCNRHYSIAGCLWGHVVDRCGSARPPRLAEDFHRTRRELKTLSGVPIATVSEFMRTQLVSNGYSAARIDVIYPPAQVASIAPAVRSISDSHPARFVFVGRLTELKGFQWLLRAAALCRQSFFIDVVGEGDLAAARRLAADLGLSERICYHGWLPRATSDAIVARSRALVFPSVWHEPFGLVAPESLALGVPVIGSRVGGIPEVVEHEVTGLLVDPNDDAGLAAAMDRLVNDPALATRLGKVGRSISADRFGVDRHMQRLTAAYERAVLAKRSDTAV